MESIALLVHISTICILIPLIVLADMVALGWLVGKPKRVSRKVMSTFHYLVWVGLFLMMSSGSIMFLSYQTYLLTLPTFYLKMSFVATLVLNGFVIDRHHLVASECEFSALDKSERRPLLISGAVSFLAWCGAAICGLLLFV